MNQSDTPRLVSTNSSAIGWNSSSASPDSLATIIKDCVFVVDGANAQQSIPEQPPQAKSRSIRKSWGRRVDKLKGPVRRS
jgi:hypothetical protein